jgi:hypothetical protein
MFSETHLHVFKDFLPGNRVFLRFGILLLASVPWPVIEKSRHFCPTEDSPATCRNGTTAKWQQVGSRRWDTLGGIWGCPDPRALPSTQHPVTREDHLPGDYHWLVSCPETLEAWLASTDGSHSGVMLPLLSVAQGSEP